MIEIPLVISITPIQSIKHKPPQLPTSDLKESHWFWRNSRTPSFWAPSEAQLTQIYKWSIPFPVTAIDWNHTCYWLSYSWVAHFELLALIPVYRFRAVYKLGISITMHRINSRYLLYYYLLLFAHLCSKDTVYKTIFAQFGDIQFPGYS